MAKTKLIWNPAARVSKPMTILEEAQAAVDGPRQSSYGHPADQTAILAKLWSIILRTEVSPAQVCLCMIALKISREMHTHNPDNLTDMAGYAYVMDLVIKGKPLVQVDPSNPNGGPLSHEQDHPTPS